jgi:hypothetical protein
MAGCAYTAVVDAAAFPVAFSGENGSRTKDDRSDKWQSDGVFHGFFLGGFMDAGYCEEL